MHVIHSRQESIKQQGLAERVSESSLAHPVLVSVFYSSILSRPAGSMFRCSGTRTASGESWGTVPMVIHPDSPYLCPSLVTLILHLCYISYTVYVHECRFPKGMWKCLVGAAGHTPVSHMVGQPTCDTIIY